ncbi:MAG: MAPEG family protein [Pseudomonadota bacterium]
MLIVTGIYAALLGLLFVALSVRTLRMRRSLQIAVGDGGSAEMLRAMRVHANFAEYTPIALLLIAMAELNGVNALVVHALGASLLMGRVSHAWGVRQMSETFLFRIFGMAMSLTTICVAALLLLYTAIRAAS